MNWQERGAWSGLRPTTPDTLPILGALLEQREGGREEGWRNVFVNGVDFECGECRSSSSAGGGKAGRGSCAPGAVCSVEGWVEGGVAGREAGGGGGREEGGERGGEGEGEGGLSVSGGREKGIKGKIDWGEERR